VQGIVNSPEYLRDQANGAKNPPSPGVSSHLLATGADAGGGPQVNVYDPTGALRFAFMAYDEHFLGGVRVAVGDVNGDGIPDIVTSPGPGGGPDIRVFDGVSGKLIREFMAYDPAFTGGVFVAVADLSGDGKQEIITSPGAGGGPDVRIFDGSTGQMTREFMAYDPVFAGGVQVAAGDVNGDGAADIITAPGAGGGPEVRVWSGRTDQLIRDFYAYDPHFAGGVNVAAGDVNGDGKADVITAPGVGGGPDVRVFSGATGALIDEFMPYGPGFLGGVRVAAIDVNGDGRAEIVTSEGFGDSSEVQIFDGTTNSRLDSFFAYDPLFASGVFVGGK
jgi:hypothetical protein